MSKISTKYLGSVLLTYQFELDEIYDEPNILKRGELISTLLRRIKKHHPDVYPHVEQGIKDMVI